MKKALLALAVAAAASSSFAQGIITFYNRNIPVDGETVTPPATVSTTDPSLYHAGVFRPAETGGGGAGAGYTVGLFLASNLNTPLATTTFRTTTSPEIFLSSQDVVVPGVGVGQTGSFVVRAWDSAFASYDLTTTVRGESGPFTSQPLGGPIPGSPPAPNATMSGFMGINMVVVPEPSTLALGAIGIGALMLRRRK